MTMASEVFHCPSCQQNLPEPDFSISLKAPWGLDGYCNQCWRASRAKAWTVYRAALALGDLRRPDRCQRCHVLADSAKPGTKIAGHHLDYKVPLFVVWVCIRCHVALHDREVASRRLVRMVPVSV